MNIRETLIEGGVKDVDDIMARFAWAALTPSGEASHVLLRLGIEPDQVPAGAVDRFFDALAATNPGSHDLVRVFRTSAAIAAARAILDALRS